MITFDIFHENPDSRRFDIDFPAETAWSTVESLYDLLMLAHQSDGGDARLLARVIRSAQRLTDQVLPLAQRKELSAAAQGSFLRISATLQNHRIPWELLRIGDQFLCEKFACGRVVSDLLPKHVPVVKSPPRTDVTVLTGDSWELTSATMERSRVIRLLRYLTHDCPNEWTLAEPTCDALTTMHFQQSVRKSRWLHFAGHGVPLDGRRVLRLSESRGSAVNTGIVVPGQASQELLTPDDLIQLTVVPETVFLNACGATLLPGEAIGAENSLVGRFLERGTRTLIGPVAPVLDSQARHFTDSFYEHVCGGMSVGPAIQLARRSCRERLGPNNLLPLCYVLYGEPDVLPFEGPNTPSLTTSRRADGLSLAAVTDVPREHGSLSEPGGGHLSLVEPEGSLWMATSSFENQDDRLDAAGVSTGQAGMRFPVNCSACGGRIETRHGVGNSVAADCGEPILCRTCSRTSSKTLGPAKAAQAADIVPFVSQVAGPDLALPEVMPAESDLVRVFRSHMLECLGRTASWIDLKSGEKITASFRPLVLSGRKSSSSPGSLGPGKSERRFTGHHFEVMNRRGEITGVIRFFVPHTIGNLSEPVALDQWQDEVAHVAAESVAPHEYCFLCSESGFSEELEKELQAEPAPHWYSSNQTIYLHDLKTRQIQFRRTDLRAFDLLTLLQRDSTAHQFQKAVVWIEGQLPLATSLSRNEVCQELGLESDAVDAALRCTAIQHNLQIEETMDFGVVITERDISAVTRGMPESPQQVAEKSGMLKRIWRAIASGSRSDS
ncbi:MAG: CHAT domain-containing protein [Planctomycetaceae bacterium]|nr:CHAT domain-containing protein [Planctomycetaceae bacterium]